MFCRACGMESKTTEKCEWCKRPLVVPGREGSVAANSQPIVATTQRRVSLSGEVFEVETTIMTPTVVGSTPVRPVVKSEHPGLAGLPTAAVSPTFFTKGRLLPTEPKSVRWEKFLAMFLPIFAISMFVVHLMPKSVLWIAILELFIVGLLMGASGAIPSYDDAIADCTGVLAIGFLFGPLVAFVGYGVVSVIRQEHNSAVAALLFFNILIRVGFYFPFLSSTDNDLGSWMGTFGLFSVIGIIDILGFMTLVITFAGWMLSSFFRPLDAA